MNHSLYTVIDTQSSASRQHRIDTGRFLTYAEIEDDANGFDSDRALTDDLRAMGVFPDVTVHLIEYLRRLNSIAAQVKAAQGQHYPRTYVGVDEGSGTKYLRLIIGDDEELTKNRSAHAFVDKISGEVFKTAGWSGPTKSKTGKGRYNLLDEESRGQLWAALEDRRSFHGSYLYASFKPRPVA